MSTLNLCSLFFNHRSEYGQDDEDEQNEKEKEEEEEGK